MKKRNDIMKESIQQVEERIIIDFDRSQSTMGTHRVSSPYWQLFSKWKKSFLKLNKRTLNSKSKEQRHNIYASFFTLYYRGN